MRQYSTGYSYRITQITLIVEQVKKNVAFSIILSWNDKLKVFATAKEIQELRTSGFGSSAWALA